MAGAALEACRLRLRPIVMTSVAFIEAVAPEFEFARKHDPVGALARRAGVKLYGKRQQHLRPGRARRADGPRLQKRDPDRRVKISQTYGPDPVLRYNGYPAADFTGEANPAVLSSGQAMGTMAELARRVLPNGMTIHQEGKQNRDREHQQGGIALGGFLEAEVGPFGRTR